MKLERLFLQSRLSIFFSQSAFNKRAQLTICYLRDSYYNSKPLFIFNTWLTDTLENLNNIHEYLQNNRIQINNANPSRSNLNLLRIFERKKEKKKNDNAQSLPPNRPSLI